MAWIQNFGWILFADIICAASRHTQLCQVHSFGTLICDCLCRIPLSDVDLITDKDMEQCYDLFHNSLPGMGLPNTSDPSGYRVFKTICIFQKC